MTIAQMHVFDRQSLRREISIAVIIPCYRVTAHIAGVIARIGPEVAAIYCVDDACSEGSGDTVTREVRDSRVQVIRHDCNRGVGGAVITGYRRALADGHDILVKIDGDGQMDPGLIDLFVQPIIDGDADYTKGNRFFYLEHAREMPFLRLFGNGALSLITKLSSGYWNIFDPTNGFTAVHRMTASLLVGRNIDNRYFFESDLLLNLYLLRAVVRDIPMASVYGSEQSNLKVRSVVLPFFFKHFRNAWRRFVIHYLVRDFSLATVEAIVGLVLLLLGLVAGSTFWLRSLLDGHAATAGQVMIAALPLLSGTQLLLSALNFDMRNVPVSPLQHAFGIARRTVHRHPDSRAMSSWLSDG